MIIHVVKLEETVHTIAESYGISESRLIQDNEITNPNKLVVGQTMVILFPEIVYTVQEGDSLEGIADAHGVSLMKLLRNNPYLSDREYIYPGEKIVISYSEENHIKLSTNGYAYPFINQNILKKTLPFLTYLTIFNYTFTPEGELNDINDSEIIQIAREYGVAPIMLISPSMENETPGNSTIHEILNNQDKQNHLINNILTNLKTKGYYGLNIDTPYILRIDRLLYIDFITNITNQLNKEGYKVIVTFSPSTFEVESGSIYRGISYASIGQAANGIMLLAYEWGYSFGPPAAVTPMNVVRDLLDYAKTQIPSSKLYIGVPNIGYVWQLPYIEGVSKAYSISSDSAIDLAGEVGAVIYYDDTSQAPYFEYVQTSEYIVWFKDARSIEALVKLVPEYGFQGIGTWNIMHYFAQMWLVINSQYEIEKVL